MEVGIAVANWADWSAALASARLGTTPAELHGSVTGFLCAGWAGPARELLAALALEGDGSDAALRALLDASARDIHAHLQRREPVGLLLPDATVSVRANAMVDWCRGFLGGLGLAGVLDRSADPDAAGILADFGRIAAMRVDSGDDDESSLEEVLDFIRAAVLHLHATLAPGSHA